MVKYRTDSERGNPLPPHWLLFPMNSKGSFICTILDRIAHTTTFVTQVMEHWLEREIAQWVHPWRINQTTHHTMNISYDGLHCWEQIPVYTTQRKQCSSACIQLFFPLSYFSFQPVLHDWCNKGCGMCYPVCGMVHIKEPLLLIDKLPMWRQRVSFLTIRMVLNHMSDAI